MKDRHEATQEILAAYALHALEPAQGEEAEALIEGHLPYCAPCREALESFQRIAGDLALAAGSAPPPRTLAAAILREARRSGRHIAAWVGRVVAGGAAAALVAILAWNLHLAGRVGDAELRQVRQTEVLATVSHPLSQVVPLTWHRPESDGSLAAAFVPGRQPMFLFGSASAPRQDHVYQVWLARDGRFVQAGTFVPDRGLVLLRIDRAPGEYDGVLITEEPRTGSEAPSSRRVGTATF